MADAIHRLCLDLAPLLGGVEVTVVPLAATGPVLCRATVTPERDQVADFPVGLRDLLGAQTLGWRIAITQDAYPVRLLAGDRVTLDDGTVHEVRTCESHPSAPGWLLRTFIITPDDEITTDDAFMLPLYFAGIEELGL